jgi:hypothetical protein
MLTGQETREIVILEEAGCFTFRGADSNSGAGIMSGSRCTSVALEEAAT